MSPAETFPDERPLSLVIRFAVSFTLRTLLVLIALAALGAVPTNAAESARTGSIMLDPEDSNPNVQRHAEPPAFILGRTGEDTAGAIVSIFGDARVTHPIHDDAVAVFGDLFIDSEVRGDAVVVFGDMQLGPRAVIHGEVVVVGGHLRRDPLAIIHGDTQEISFGARLGDVDWLRPWVERAVFYGRPLATGPGLGWAWTLAAGSLALYILIAMLFGSAVRKCAETLERHPGESLIAALLAILLLPVLLLLLLITVVGITVIPFILIGLFCAALFGKPVVLTALGRRLASFAGSSTSTFSNMPIALATLVGGIFVTLLYLVPVLGIIAFNVVGILGLGAVLYTSLRLIGARQSGASPSTAGSTAPSPSDTTQATPAHADATAGNAAATQAAPADAGDLMHGQTATNLDPADASNVEPAAPTSQFHASQPHGARSDGSPPHEPQPRGAQPHDPPPNGPRTADPGTPSGGPGATSPASALTTLPRAGFGIRMIALLIDTILVAIVINVLTDGNLFLLILATYGAVMWKLKGTTIGGIVCHLKVVRLDGHELGWDTAIVRALSCFLSIAFAGLGFFWILFDAERQSWHDKIAGTVVVRSPRSIPLL